MYFINQLQAYIYELLFIARVYYFCAIRAACVKMGKQNREKSVFCYNLDK